MKKIILLILLKGIMYSSICQLTHSVSIGPDVGRGANFGKSSKVSIGGSFEYLARFSTMIGVRLSAGYNRFNDKNYDNTYVSFLPIRAGVQIFVYEDIFFIYPEAGIATYKSSNPDPALTKFSWALGGGYRQRLTSSQFLQFTAGFNYFRHNPNLTYTWFNFRAAYGLSFGKKNIPKE